MNKPFTVQCGYAAYFANTITVEAATLEEALEHAIETANQDPNWNSLDHCGPTFIDACCVGDNANPWDRDATLPIPDRFTEHGAPPVVTITDPRRPDGGIKVTGGRVLIRFEAEAVRVTAERCDPPHPPGNKPLVTIRSRPNERPEVTITEGRARIRLLHD